MTAATLAYLIAVLLVAAGIADVKSREPYVCPACGSNRADGHSTECPWRHKP